MFPCSPGNLRCGNTGSHHRANYTTLHVIVPSQERGSQLESAGERLNELNDLLSRARVNAGATVADLTQERDEVKALLMSTLQVHSRLGHKSRGHKGIHFCLQASCGLHVQV